MASKNAFALLGDDDGGDHSNSSDSGESDGEQKPITKVSPLSSLPLIIVCEVRNVFGISAITSVSIATPTHDARGHTYAYTLRIHTTHTHINTHNTHVYKISHAVKRTRTPNSEARTVRTQQMPTLFVVVQAAVAKPIPQKAQQPRTPHSSSPSPSPPSRSSLSPGSPSSHMSTSPRGGGGQWTTQQTRSNNHNNNGNNNRSPRPQQQQQQQKPFFKRK